MSEPDAISWPSLDEEDRRRRVNGEACWHCGATDRPLWDGGWGRDEAGRPWRVRRCAGYEHDPEGRGWPR